MQGLNFVAGMIIMNIEDEALAYAVLIKLMEKNDWNRLYIEQTPKLFELVYKIRFYMNKELPKLIKYFDQIILSLEPLLASPFFTLFSNIVDIPSA